MTKLIKLGAATLAVLTLGIGVYHFATPKIEVENLSEALVDELIVELPSSRVSVGPLEPGSLSRVYFTRQSDSGVARFRVVSGDGTERIGEFSYAVEGQPFRAVRFTIDTGGEVHVSISG